MSTPANRPSSVVVSMDSDNLDDLMEEVMIGFQMSSPTDSSFSSPGRMFFYLC
jgi:hypothetical protein